MFIAIAYSKAYAAHAEGIPSTGKGASPCATPVLIIM
jgi:hypothetical protein